MTGRMPYDFFLILAAIVAFAFVFLIFFTSKGDAMSSGGSIRTTFKGRATFDDQIAKVTLYCAGAFVFLMVLLNFLSPKG